MFTESTPRRAIVALAASAVLATGVGGVAFLEQASASNSAATQAQAFPVLQQGANGRPVVLLQRLLSAHGINTPADGSFGPGTLASVKAFQSSKRIATDGSVGPQTWARLLPTLNYGDKGNQVKVLQLSLRDAGASVAVDGSFGPATRTAVQNVQRKHKHSASGTVDSRTWHALMQAKPAGSQTPSPTASPKPKGAREIIVVDQRKSGSNGDHNCAPASAVMAMVAAGHRPAGYRSNATEADKRVMVEKMANAMGTGNNGTSVNGIVRGLKASGVSHEQTTTDKALAAVRAGKPVMLNGHTKNLEWQNVSRGVGHWIVVVEHKGGDNYVAIDPWRGRKVDTTGKALTKFTNAPADRSRANNQLIIR